MKKFEFLFNEQSYCTPDVVQNLNSSKSTRQNLHSSDSSLNLMVIKIAASVEDERFHWNVNRDEIISVLEGKVTIEQKLSGRIISSIVSGDSNAFFSIAANTPHRITSITPYSYILEIIGGKFEHGSTKYED